MIIFAVFRKLEKIKKFSSSFCLNFCIVHVDCSSRYETFPLSFIERKFCGVRKIKKNVFLGLKHHQKSRVELLSDLECFLSSFFFLKSSNEVTSMKSRFSLNSFFWVNLNSSTTKIIHVLLAWATWEDKGGKRWTQQVWNN